MTQLDLFSDQITDQPERDASLRPRRPALRGREPEATAARVAEAAARAWHRSRGGTALEVPLGVVAALAQLAAPAGRPDPAAALLALTPDQLWRTLERIWSVRWLSRPELVEWAAPLHIWLRNATPDPHRLQAVHDVAAEALGTGLLDLTGSPDPLERSRADLLGRLLMMLRSEGTKRYLAEEHTPAEMAELVARLALVSPEQLKPGSWLAEPTAGTGGMFRAVAEVLREAGRSPSEIGWFMQDVDEAAAACCAVNAIVWDLGPRVLVYCGDILTTPDGWERADADRREILAHHARVVGAALPVARIQRALAPLDPPGIREKPEGD